jgi:hypothetical protein
MLSAIPQKAVFWLAVMTLAVVAYIRDRTITQPDGVLAADAPEQTRQTSSAAAYQFGDWTLIPLFDYQLTARVLSVERYPVGPRSSLSSVDIVLGWGPMSDNAVLSDVEVAQQHRLHTISSRRNRVSIDTLVQNSANTHMIAASEAVDAVLQKARKGHLIQASGYLVRAENLTSKTWQSSTVRDDKGPDSSELFLVKDIELLGTPNSIGQRPTMAQAETPDTLLAAKATAKQNSKGIAIPLRSQIRSGSKPSQPSSDSSAVAQQGLGTQLQNEQLNPPVPQKRAQWLQNAEDVDRFLASAKINGLGSRGAIINGQFVRLNKTIDFRTGLKLTHIDGNQLQFVDDMGQIYLKDVMMEEAQSGG